MIGIRGMGSNIAKEFVSILNGLDDVYEVGRNHILPPAAADRYLLCQGFLYGKRRVDMTNDEVSDTYRINYVQVVGMCDNLLEHNDNVRICVVGSESGVTGSYDECYADSKRLVHNYVETKNVKPNQQLVCVAPSIIEDAGMTLRRCDVDNLDKLRSNHPKGRFLTSREVAMMIFFLLYIDQGYTTGVVIRMNGGMKR
jgi:NAD(P)-dependent dehydrogenase (short-subunit alcohol dehydrogenase family)